MVCKRISRANGFKLALGSLALVWFILLISGISGLVQADSGGGVQISEQVVEQVQAPTVFTQSLVNAIDAAGGDWINASLALLIIGLPIIALYRILAWAAGKMKKPVGTLWTNILVKILSVIVGSEMEWKNRILAKHAPPGTEKAERLKVLKKLSKDHPLVSDEIKGIVDNMTKHDRAMGFQKT